jgi:hypothetical protein
MGLPGLHLNFGRHSVDLKDKAGLLACTSSESECEDTYYCLANVRIRFHVTPPMLMNIIGCLIEGN